MKISVSFTFEISEEQLQLLEKIDSDKYYSETSVALDLCEMGLIEYDNDDFPYLTVLGDKVLSEYKSIGPFV